MSEPNGPAGSPEADGQLFQAIRPTADVQAGSAGLPGGAETAADLERGNLCRTETQPQFDICLTTRFRGSGGPLSPLGDRFELKKDDKMYGMTPMGVFFTAIFPLVINDQALCQQLQSVQRWGRVVLFAAFFFPVT